MPGGCREKLIPELSRLATFLEVGDRVKLCQDPRCLFLRHTVQKHAVRSFQKAGQLLPERHTGPSRQTSLRKVAGFGANQIVREVRTAFLNARNAFDRLRLTQELLTQATLSLDLAQTRYDLGLGSIVELSQAQLNQTAAEVSGASARYEYQILRSVLRYQLGEGVL